MAIFALVFTFYLYVKVSATFSNSSSITVLRFPVIVLFFSGMHGMSVLDSRLDQDLCIACVAFLQTLNTGSLFYATLNALAYFYMVCQAPAVQLYLMECVTPPQCFRVSKTLHLLQHLIISTAICICDGLNFLPENLNFMLENRIFTLWQASL